MRSTKTIQEMEHEELRVYSKILFVDIRNTKLNVFTRNRNSLYCNPALK
jgi:hypothetical protein